MADIPILLTATIRPHSSPGIVNVNQDERDRYEQYRHALAYVRRSRLFDHIIFADNSRSPLFSSIAAYANRLSSRRVKVEAVSYPIENEFEVSGKGYGEGWLISQALAHYPDPRPDSFFKATGRYRIRNLFRLTHTIRSALTRTPDLDLVCQDFVPRKDGRYSASTTFFWCKLALWDSLFSDIYNYVDDPNEVFFEHIFADTIRRAVLGNSARVATLPIPLLIEATDTLFNRPKTNNHTLYRAMIRTYLAYLLRRRSTLRLLKADDVACGPHTLSGETHR